MASPLLEDGRGEALPICSFDPSTNFSDITFE
jgi:hypothetical protein